LLDGNSGPGEFAKKTLNLIPMLTIRVSIDTHKLLIGGSMWHKLEYSSESIDNLKKEMQRLQDEGKRLLMESKRLEQEEQEGEMSDYEFIFQRGANRESGRPSWLPFH
jgi:hypothetical protein